MTVLVRHLTFVSQPTLLVDIDPCQLSLDICHTLSSVRFALQPCQQLALPCLPVRPSSPGPRPSLRRQTPCPVRRAGPLQTPFFASALPFAPLPCRPARASQAVAFASQRLALPCASLASLAMLPGAISSLLALHLASSASRQAANRHTSSPYCSQHLTSLPCFACTAMSSQPLSALLACHTCLPLPQALCLIFLPPSSRLSALTQLVSLPSTCQALQQLVTLDQPSYQPDIQQQPCQALPLLGLCQQPSASAMLVNLPCSLSLTFVICRQQLACTLAILVICQRCAARAAHLQALRR